MKKTNDLPSMKSSAADTLFLSQKGKQSARGDKSDKGSIDKEIVSLVKIINSKRDYYTTSSCSGRIILLKEKDMKEEQLFLFRSHAPVSFKEMLRELRKAVKEYGGMIYFKQEACILHAAAASLAAGQKLVDAARFAGWKRSGIIATNRRIIAELISTEHMSLPVAANGRILFPDDYLLHVLKEANRKLQRTQEKIKRLGQILGRKDKHAPA